MDESKDQKSDSIARKMTDYLEEDKGDGEKNKK